MVGGNLNVGIYKRGGSLPIGRRRVFKGETRRDWFDF